MLTLSQVVFVLYTVNKCDNIILGDALMNYLQRLAQETQTKFWYDSSIPSEIDAAIENGAVGVRCNDQSGFDVQDAAGGS